MDVQRKSINRILELLTLMAILYIGFNYWGNIVGILQYGYGILSPFILGGCIAFVLNIPMTVLEKKISNVKNKKIRVLIEKGNTAISLVISCIMILGIVVLASYIVIPQIIETVKVFPETFENSISALQKWVVGRDWLSNDIVNWVSSIEINWDGILSKVKTVAFDGVGIMLSSTVGIAATFANSIVNFGIGFIFAIYILLQKEKLGDQCKKVLYAFLQEKKADSISEVMALTSQAFSNFITGQCLEAAILGMMFFVTMLVLNFPYALVISVLIAFTSLIPLLGSFIGCAIGAFLIVMVNPVKAGLFLLVFLVLQQIEGNVVYPRVVGNSVGLPSIWVFVAITIGGSMMGIVGMIIFIPIFSVVYVLLRREVYSRLEKKKINKLNI